MDCDSENMIIIKQNILLIVLITTITEVYQQI